MYVHLASGGCTVRGPRSVIGALTLQGLNSEGITIDKFHDFTFDMQEKDILQCQVSFTSTFSHNRNIVCVMFSSVKCQ